MVFYRSYTNDNSNQYKSNNMNGDLNNIIEVVNEVCNVDIRMRNRTRAFIDAKKIYMHIASKIGYFTQTDIGIHVGNDHAAVNHHTKSFEMILRSDPQLRKNLDTCWLKVNNILGLKNFNYKDKIMMNWKDLTIQQRKSLAEISDKYYNENKVNEPVYV